MEIKIEKGTTVPDVQRKRRYQKYPFKQMEIGDRITIPSEEGLSPSKLSVRTHQAAYRYKRHVDKDFNFTTRVIEGKVYLWRTEG